MFAFEERERTLFQTTFPQLPAWVRLTSGWMLGHFEKFLGRTTNIASISWHWQFWNTRMPWARTFEQRGSLSWLRFWQLAFEQRVVVIDFVFGTFEQRGIPSWLRFWQLTFEQRGSPSWLVFGSLFRGKLGSVDFVTPIERTH